MKKISSALKEKIFKVITGQADLAAFESWLYQQKDLFSRINEEFYFELFSFNYKQKGARYLLKEALKKHFNEVEFRLSQLMAILKELSLTDQLNEDLLTEIHDIWLKKGYEFLGPLVFCYYEISDDYYMPNKELLGKNSSELALKLLNKLEAEWQKENFDIDSFEFLPIENDSYYGIERVEDTEEKEPLKVAKRRVWWRFWT